MTPVIVGANWSFNDIVLFDCEVDATFPSPSYILDETGLTVNVSLPFGVPDKLIPNVYSFPTIEIVEGVVLDNVAFPPLNENSKSPTSKEPEPELVL